MVVPELSGFIYALCGNPHSYILEHHASAGKAAA
jgi:hypothetical protein